LLSIFIKIKQFEIFLKSRF